MKVGVLYNLPEDTLQDSMPDRLADLDVLETAGAVRAALEAGGRQASTVNICETGFAGLEAYDAIFNLAETNAGCPLSASAITARLESLGLAYTGAGPRALEVCQNKAWAKSILARQGLPTPRFQVICGTADLHTALEYPLIVKPLHEDGSVGIHGDAVVHDAAGLAAKAGEIRRDYRQPALVEEYIDGREIHAAVAVRHGRLHVFPPVETLFTAPPGAPRIVSYEAKWIPGSTDKAGIVPGCRAGLEPALEAEIQVLAVRVCRALGCQAYTRVDFRLRGEQPYVLEVNPNPCIALHEASFITAAGYAGWSYEAAIGGILDARRPNPAPARSAGRKVHPVFGPWRGRSGLAGARPA